MTTMVGRTIYYAGGKYLVRARVIEQSFSPDILRITTGEEVFSISSSDALMTLNDAADACEDKAKYWENEANKISNMMAGGNFIEPL